MERQDFYIKRKETMQARYKELRSQKEPKKLKRDECLKILQDEYEGLSPGTIKQILSNSNYQKAINKKTNT